MMGAVADRTPSATPPFADMVGREGDLAEVERRFAEGARLVTVVGPPGIGKTRLAAAWLDGLRADDGVEAAWVDLSTSRGRDELCARVAHELGLRLSWIDAPDRVEELGWAIDGRGEVCLALDEAEGCRDELAQLLERWLAVASGAKALVTSRARLSIPGEVLVELGPLPDDDAARLLAARAGTDPSDALTRLARRLDGIPLALELVAARLHLLTPDEVLARLDDGLEVIESGPDASLRGALQASWARLGEGERAALARCALFEGTFSTAAAEAVIGDGALASLQGLRDQSLLARDGRRHRLYGPVRAFAREHLDDAARADAQRRHAAFFGALAARARAELRGPDGERALDALVREVDHLRAARRHAEGDAARALALGVAEVALTRGPIAEALDVLETFDDVEATRGRALELLGRTDEAVAAYRDAAAGGDPLASTWLAHAELARGAVDAAVDAVQAACERAADGTAERVEALRVSGIVHHARGELDAARTDYETARALADELGLTRRAAQLRADVASVRLQQGRLDEAQAGYRAAVEGLDEATEPIARAIAEGNLAILEQERGALDAAAEQLGRALARMRRIGHRLYAAHVGGYLGAVEHERGDLDAACARYAEALDGLRRVGDARQTAVFAALRGAAEATRGHPEAATEAFDEAERALAAVDDPGVAHVVALCRAHEALATGGDAGRAAAAEALAAREGDPAVGASDDARLARRLLRDALGHGALHVDAAAQRVVLPDGEVVDLSTRAVLWRLVEALAAARRERPPRPLSSHDLVEAGWPGEATTGASGLNRVKVSLSTLRKLGLRDVLVRVDDGYLFDPQIPLR